MHADSQEYVNKQINPRSDDSHHCVRGFPEATVAWERPRIMSLRTAHGEWIPTVRKKEVTQTRMRGRQQKAKVKGRYQDEKQQVHINTGLNPWSSKQIGNIDVGHRILVAFIPKETHGVGVN